MDQIEFCDVEKPLSCVSKTASNSTSGKLLFDVDVKKRIFKDKDDVDYDAADLPIKIQREDCLCDWRYCNSSYRIIWKWYIVVISVVFKSIL